MIPNLINTAIGLWLVYAAVLNPAEIGGAAVVVASGVVVFVVAIWAYQADYLKWPATTTGALGAGLAVYAGFRLFEPSGFITFWIVLFAGVTIAIVSLWSAIYRRPGAPEYAASREPHQMPAGAGAAPAEAHK
ncbi:MAG: hypothetical protein ACREQI_04175 [Candidatus Binataceae bacterium]